MEVMGGEKEIVVPFSEDHVEGQSGGGVQYLTCDVAGDRCENCGTADAAGPALDLSNRLLLEDVVLEEREQCLVSVEVGP
ncbi:hypothetical protein A2U01_0064591, partial [Trifolium medium]|nr:hypothetical protein [Trifolium medium]